MSMSDLTRDSTRRSFLKTTAYVAPAILTLKAVPALASQGSDPQKGNNGVGNGLDPQPPGNPPINDGPGTSPGNPGLGGGPPNGVGGGPPLFISGRVGGPGGS